MLQKTYELDFNKNRFILVNNITGTIYNPRLKIKFNNDLNNENIDLTSLFSEIFYYYNGNQIDTKLNKNLLKIHSELKSINYNENFILPFPSFDNGIFVKEKDILKFVFNYNENIELFNNIEKINFIIDYNNNIENNISYYINLNEMGYSLLQNKYIIRFNRDNYKNKILFYFTDFKDEIINNLNKQFDYIEISKNYNIIKKITFEEFNLTNKFNNSFCYSFLDNDDAYYEIIIYKNIHTNTYSNKLNVYYYQKEYSKYLCKDLCNNIIIHPNNMTSKYNRQFFIINNNYNKISKNISQITLVLPLKNNNIIINNTKEIINEIIIDIYNYNNCQLNNDLKFEIKDSNIYIYLLNYEDFYYYNRSSIDTFKELNIRIDYSNNDIINNLNDDAYLSIDYLIV